MGIKIRLGARVLTVVVALACVGSAARGQTTETEEERWLHTSIFQGGLNEPKDPTDKKTPNQLNIPTGNPEKLAAFRNAFYLAYAVPWDASRKDALKFASTLTKGSDPLKRVQIYQTVFHDQYERYRAEGDAPSLSIDYAMGAAEEAVEKALKGGPLPKSPTSSVPLARRLNDWVTKPWGEYGGDYRNGLRFERLQQLIKKLDATGEAGPGESLDPLTTSKFVAFRSLWRLGGAKILGGGMEITFAEITALAEELVTMNQAVTRVEIFGNTFRRLLTTRKPKDGQSFDDFKKEIIEESKNLAKSADLKAVNIGDEQGSTPKAVGAN